MRTITDICWSCPFRCCTSFTSQSETSATCTFCESISLTSLIYQWGVHSESISTLKFNLFLCLLQNVLLLVMSVVCRSMRSTCSAGFHFVEVVSITFHKCQNANHCIIVQTFMCSVTGLPPVASYYLCLMLYLRETVSSVRASVCGCRQMQADAGGCGRMQACEVPGLQALRGTTAR